MVDLTCTPWRRYGHDRVYVARGAARLGYLDRVTGAISVDDEPERHAVEAALVAGGWLAAPAVEWSVTLPGDTATYRPGAGAREMARAEREAAPVRTTVARLLGVHTAERAWRVGADGEEAVARRLARLGPGWTAVHDLPIGTNGANVDHLVAGPGGVFSLNTKNHRGSVWVGGSTVLHNGQRQDYVRKSRWEAERVARVLTGATGRPVTVRGVVVVIADELTVKEQPRDVTVVARREIDRWLRRHPASVDAGTLATLVRAIRDPRTWQPP